MDGPSAEVFFTTLAEIALPAARKCLGDADAIEIFSVLLPICLHCQQQAAARDFANRLARVTNELEAVDGKLARLDRAKSNFISVAGHGLKTPLTLIEGYTTLLCDLLPDSTEQSLTMLNGIHTSIGRLRDIVDDLTDVSLIANELLALKYQPPQLNQLFNSLARELAKSTSQRRLILEVRLSLAGETLLLADPDRRHQAFLNMLSNAVKYTPDGGRISVDRRVLPGFVEITIADTGIGIPIEDQVTIFEKPEQIGQVSLHSSGSTKFRGGCPGLRLTITRGIIQAHGGGKFGLNQMVMMK